MGIIATIKSKPLSLHGIQARPATCLSCFTSHCMAPCVVSSQLSGSKFIHFDLIVIQAQQGPGKGSPFKPAL